MQLIRGASGRLTISTLRPFGQHPLDDLPREADLLGGHRREPGSRQQEQAERDEASMSHVRFSVEGVTIRHVFWGPSTTTAAQISTGQCPPSEYA